MFRSLTAFETAFDRVAGGYFLMASRTGGSLTGGRDGVEAWNISAGATYGGWENFSFLKVTTDEGLVGWSEFMENFGSEGLSVIIRRLGDRIMGMDPRQTERIVAYMHGITRQAPGGINQQAIAAIENAMMDVAAKALGVSVSRMLGGPIRDRIPVYWSHFGTYRVRSAALMGVKPLTSYDDLAEHAREVKALGFRALKTNVFLYDQDGRNPRGWRPGFGAPFAPELNVDRSVIRNLVMHLEAMRDGAGPDVDILLDLNFHARTEGFLKILRAIAKLDMFWVEIDSFTPQALAYVRRQSPHPISSCETLLGLRAFMPYFREQAMDVAIIDTPWNGVWQSMKIAAAADAHEVNVAPHNFYGHLCTMMNAHFAAAVPNLRIMETDIDRIADPATSLPHMLPSESAFGEALAALGVGAGHHVVVYDAAGVFSSPRVWWTFRIFGAKQVFILDGGLPKWKAEGRPVEQGITTRSPKQFESVLNTRVVAGSGDILYRLFDAGLVAPVDDHMGAALGERQRHGAAEAAGGAGDERHLAVEREDLGHGSNLRCRGRGQRPARSDFASMA